MKAADLREAPAGEAKADELEKLQTYYISALSEALVRDADLGRLETELAAEELGRMPLVEPAEAYLRDSAFALRYLCLRGKPRVERLDAEQLDVLRLFLRTGVDPSSPRVRAFALQTAAGAMGEAADLCRERTLPLGLMTRAVENRELRPEQLATLEGLLPIIEWEVEDSIHMKVTVELMLSD